MEAVEIQKEEIDLAKELEEKYGSGTISLETGEFSPTKQTFDRKPYIYYQNITIT